VFNDYDAQGVRWALNTALDLFWDRDSWLQMMRNAMAQDFSWDKQSREYVRLYQQLIS
jgi:starch synthase